MIDEDLLNELERKDLIIQNLQKQLKENLTYFKTDSMYNSLEKLKNELMRKDSEISYLSSKIESLTNENLNLSQKNTLLNQEFFDFKLKSCNEIEKLNEIIKSNSLSINNFQNINEKMKQQLSKISYDNSNIIQSNENMNNKLNEYENNLYNCENDNDRLRNEVEALKEKCLAKEMELKEIKYKYEEFNSDLKGFNDKFMLMQKENDDTKNYINRIISDLTYWLRDGDFLMIQFPTLLYDNSNINGIDFAPLYDALIALQEKLNNLINNEKKKLTPDQENIIQDNVNLIKDNLSLKNLLNMKENTIRMMIKELNNKI